VDFITDTNATPLSISRASATIPSVRLMNQSNLVASQAGFFSALPALRSRTPLHRCYTGALISSPEESVSVQTRFSVTTGVRALCISAQAKGAKDEPQRIRTTRSLAQRSGFGEFPINLPQARLWPVFALPGLCDPETIPLRGVRSSWRWAGLPKEANRKCSAGRSALRCSPSCPPTLYLIRAICRLNQEPIFNVRRGA